jgi:hypothetical protein
VMLKTAGLFSSGITVFDIGVTLTLRLIADIKFREKSIAKMKINKLLVFMLNILKKAYLNIFIYDR